MPGNDCFSNKFEAKRFLMNLCDEELTIHVSDGRKFTGTLWCTDNAANIVLGSCIEYPSPSDSHFDNLKRNLATVVIPGQHITKVECAKCLLNK